MIRPDRDSHDSTPAYDALRDMALGVEYYEDAYCGEDAPFRDRQPSADELCRMLQRMSCLADRVLCEHKRMRNILLRLSKRKKNK